MNRRGLPRFVVKQSEVDLTERETEQRTPELDEAEEMLGVQRSKSETKSRTRVARKCWF